MTIHCDRDEVSTASSCRAAGLLGVFLVATVLTGCGEDAVRDVVQGPRPVGPATVSLTPESPSYQTGQLVVIHVRVDEASNVGSIPFHLRYDPAVLAFVEPAIEGPFMGADGATTVFLAADTGEEVVVGLSRLGEPQGMSGLGVLATFHFHAIAPGDCGFAFTDASVKDPQAENMPAAFRSASVRIQ